MPAKVIEYQRVSWGPRVRLVGLFALRYEREGGRHIEALLQRLQALGVPRASVTGLECLFNHAGAAHRVGDLYSDRTFRSRFVTMAKQVAGLRVSQHICQLPPFVVPLLDDALARLQLSSYSDPASSGIAPWKQALPYAGGRPAKHLCRAVQRP